MVNVNLGSQSDTFVAVDIIPITPNDSVDLPNGVRALRAQVAGTLRITTGVGIVRDTYIAADKEFPVYTQRVHATGTTATGIEGFL